MASTLARAAEIMQGRLHGDDAEFRGVSTDTRTLSAGELYFALRGPNFDGADFVDAAAGRRAAGAVVQSRVDSALARIAVADTRRALGELASSWRREMPARVVGITGSNGKTTLKELIASCLGHAGETLATEGNLNNEIGVPLMLARLSEKHRYAVLELGANHVGEIAYLTGLVRPQVVALTNAGPAHLEGFGSLDGVARGKGEILTGDSRPEHAVLNADDRYYDYWRELASDLPVTSFGLAAGADVSAADIEPTGTGSRFRLMLPEGCVDVTLPLAGDHNVLNACAAAAVCRALGLSAGMIRRGIESVRPIGGRLRRLAAAGGAALYDDTYNANPTSVLAAARFLATRPGEGWLVLGDMAELGADAAALHREAGEQAKAAGVMRLYAAGPLSRHAAEGFGDGAEWFPTVDELIAVLASAAPGADVNLLVKGSRSSRMERVVAALAGDAGGEG